VRAVTGRVTLEGVLRDAAGNPMGTREVTDADGIRVHLVRSGSLVDSALTVSGSFRLAGEQGQGYQVRARMGPTLTVSTAAFAIGDADVDLAQPLLLASTGDLSASPNPFTTSVSIRFDLALSSNVALDVFSLAGLRVRALASQSLPPGSHVVEWDGKGLTGPLADGPYWIVFTAPGREEAELVFKGP
jgi:hypothetical protein